MYRLYFGAGATVDSGGGPGPGPGVGSIPSLANASIGTRLERIYAAIAEHNAPSSSRSEYWLMGKIGQLRGLNLTSGYKSRETHLMNLYQNLTGSVYTGSRSEELILRAIEEAL